MKPPRCCECGAPAGPRPYRVSPYNGVRLAAACYCAGCYELAFNRPAQERAWQLARVGRGTGYRRAG